MSPDTLATIGGIVFLAGLLLALRMIRPIGSPRPRHSAAYVNAHRPAICPPATLALPAAEEPVTVTGPWACPEVTATRPDALNTVRSAT